ncbi:ferric reductase, partial [Bifidobacterium sp. MSK23_125]|nr:ferric reductase [Bifidobacterium sp. MSK23_125]
RIVLVAVVLACLHFILVFYIKDLTAFIVTMDVTTGLVLAWYAWVKLRYRMFAARGKVVSARRVSNDIVEIL